MVDPYIEEQKAKEDARLKKYLEQGQIYHDSPTFAEYALKCDLNGIKRKTHFFGLVDPFFILYAHNNHLVRKYAIPILGILFLSGAIGMALTQLVFYVFSIPNPIIVNGIDAMTAAGFCVSMLFGIAVNDVITNYRAHAQQILHKVIFK